jgi:hypothetical protein
MNKREFFIFAGILFILLGAYHYFTINSPATRAVQEAARLAQEQKRRAAEEQAQLRREHDESRVEVVVASGRWKNSNRVQLHSNHWVRIDFEGRIELRGSALSSWGDQITFSTQLDSRKSVWQDLPVAWMWFKSLESRNVNVTITQCPKNVCRKDRFFDGAPVFGMTTL